MPVTRQGATRRPRDSQRSKIYEWEEAELVKAFEGKEAPEHLRKHSLAECQELVRQIYERYGARKYPTVEDGRSRRRAAGSLETIKLPRWTRVIWQVCHEAAHGLACLYTTTEPPHGRVFARIYFDLLVMFGKLDAKELRTSMKARRIKRDRSQRVAPPPATLIRTWKKKRGEHDGRGRLSTYGRLRHHALR